MINRRHRFHGHGSLRYVYTHGQVVRGPILSLKHTLNPKRKTYRLAVVVSKKVMKSAVMRNRIRRRLYETVRAQEARITEPHDLVFTVFNEQIIDLSSSELELMVKSQLKQAGVTKSTVKT